MTFRSGTLWRTAYSLDFTAQANQNIRTGGGGTKTIDGKTWTWDNDANVASANIVNGTGLVIVANATNTNYFPGGNIRNAATLTIPVLSVIPNFTITQNAVRVLVRALTDANANTEGHQLFFEYPPSPRDQNMGVLKAFNGSLGFQSDSNIDPVAGAPALNYEVPYTFNTVNSGDDILGITFLPPRTMQYWSGTFVAGEKMRLTTGRGDLYQNVGIGSMRYSTGIRLGICQFTINTLASLTTTFTHLRVDYCDFLPAL